MPDADDSEILLSSDQISRARERIKQWPLEERQSLARMTEREARLIALLVAQLDIRPVDGKET